MRAREKQWKPKFLEGLRQCANVRMACELAGITRMGAYSARTSDPQFAADWDRVIEDAVDELEKEAWRRAYAGVTRREPIMYQGEQVAEKIITEYSDKMMELLLKANRPAKYREQVKIITANEADQAIDEALSKHNLPKPEIFAGETLTEGEM